MIAAEKSEDQRNLEVAERWCVAKGPGWRLGIQTGRGGTAPVFAVHGPTGDYALKIYDERFSSGDKGDLEEKRVLQQVALGDHKCPHLVKIYDGGRFEERLYLLMNRALGTELEKILGEIPRNKIRPIIDKIAQSCEFLRSNNICHRDIKSSNIFISDDYDTITLLDLSVMRDIQDPVGIGTDHGDQLPIVATARYSPPEYLFRLEEPSPDYWHGLDIYQIGGVLHDLIMRFPMFEEEYKISKENRYRFAWAVATKTPLVHADDVDLDLISLARRSLDKNWINRRALQISDFRLDQANTGTAALAVFGLMASTPPNPPPPPALDLRTVAKALEGELNDKLHRLGVTAIHEVRPEDSWRAANLTFRWSVVSAAVGLAVDEVELDVRLWQSLDLGTAMIQSSVELVAQVDGALRKSNIELPSVQDDGSAAATISENIIGSLNTLSAQALSAT